MTRTTSFRALRLAAVLALGAPLTADAAPDNTVVRPRPPN